MSNLCINITIDTVLKFDANDVMTLLHVLAHKNYISDVL